MKVFGNDNKSKSWALQLNAHLNGKAGLDAVDSTTGEPIVTVIDFSSTGRVIILSAAKRILEEEGYDPYEHSNNWSADGHLFLERERTTE